MRLECIINFSTDQQLFHPELDEEKDSVKEKGEKRKNLPLWKPNGPNSTPAMVRRLSLFFYETHNLKNNK